MRKMVCEAQHDALVPDERSQIGPVGIGHEVEIAQRALVLTQHLGEVYDLHSCPGTQARHQRMRFGAYEAVSCYQEETPGR